MSPVNLPVDVLRYMSAEFRMDIFPKDSSVTAGSDGASLFSVAGLLDGNLLDQAVRQYSGILRTSHLPAAASLFAKAYGRILTGLLYALSAYDIGIKPDPARMELLISTNRSELRLFLFGVEVIPAPNGGNRSAWRDLVLKELYADHLNPLLTRLAGSYHVQPAALWENSLVYILHYYGVWKHSTLFSPDRRLVLDEDFRYLTSEAPASLFGAADGNPFDVEGRLIPHPIHDGQTLRIRKTCCLKYQTGAGRACTVCPRIEDSDRPALFIKD